MVCWSSRAIASDWMEKHGRKQECMLSVSLFMLVSCIQVFVYICIYIYVCVCVVHTLLCFQFTNALPSPGKAQESQKRLTCWNAWAGLVKMLSSPVPNLFAAKKKESYCQRISGILQRIVIKTDVDRTLLQHTAAQICAIICVSGSSSIFQFATKSTL